MELTREELQKYLSKDIDEVSRSAIQEALDTDQIKVEFAIAEKHLSLIHDSMPVSLGDKSGTGWLRNITGGGSGTLTGKRTSDGKIKTDMTNTEYDTLCSLTEKFYNFTEEVSDNSNLNPITLYRGFRISHLDNTIDESAKRTYFQEHIFDAIPSSASWTMDVPKQMSAPNEGQDAVIMCLAINTSFPLIVMSYPDNERRTDSGAPAIDISRAEVLDAIVASSAYLRKKKEEEEQRLELIHQQQEQHKKVLSEQGMTEMNILKFNLKEHFSDETSAFITGKTAKVDDIYIGTNGKTYILKNIAYVFTF